MTIGAGCVERGVEVTGDGYQGGNVYLVNADRPTRPARRFSPPRPSVAARQSIMPGDCVKVIVAFRGPDGSFAAERLWIRAALALEDGTYVGHLEYVLPDEPHGIFEFGPEHVIDLAECDDD